MKTAKKQAAPAAPLSLKKPAGLSRPFLWGTLGVFLIGISLGIAAVFVLRDDYSGMVWIEGGEFVMGNDKFPEARPLHKVSVDGFWMDRTEVTNAQWKKFVAATGYVTIAEQTPTKEQYPTAPPENLVAGSLVFSPPLDLPDAECQTCLDNNSWHLWWKYVPGANWRHPLGPDSDIEGKDNYPVVHIAYEDAVAYCKWANKRLPTEAEWEFAARGGLEQKPFYWGDVKYPDGQHMANTWQGKFPKEDTGEDGFKGIAPVAQFPANGFGLYDLSGNVWEWTNDWFRQNAYENGESINPQGPAYSIDPRQGQHERLRVTRGGSFLCADNYCVRYMAGARHHGAIDTGTNHTGFRCVRSR